jgi:glycosyltransferase involved in cell wall biosynthesis
MNVAIASPRAGAYSETFIQMQMERLPCRLRIHGGPVAAETIPGGPIRPASSLRGLTDLVIETARRGNRTEGSQRRELARRLRRAQIDVVLANYGPVGVALLPVCQKSSIPLVVHFHGYDAHQKSTVRRHMDSYRALGRRASKVVAVSNVMARALESYGIPADRIHVTRCGCDPAAFPEKVSFDHPPVFFALGRFVDKKAPYLTVLAFRKVHEQLPAARLIVGGDGPLMEVTRNLVRQCGLDDAVELPGVLAPSQVRDHMQAATAFVQHSIVPVSGPAEGDSEGTPVVVLEAMSSGLPVIATRHAGIQEVVEHERTGLLCDERDVDGMAAAMLRAARDTEFARRLGRAGRERVLASYTADHYIGSLRQVLAATVDTA